MKILLRSAMMWDCEMDRLMEMMRDKYTIIFKTRVAAREQSISIVH
jgi:hypothetical protein